MTRGSVWGSRVVGWVSGMVLSPAVGIGGQVAASAGGGGGCCRWTWFGSPGGGIVK